MQPAVAQAIREHYLPRFDGDAIPVSDAGLALSLADKLDSLVGLFGAGVNAERQRRSIWPAPRRAGDRERVDSGQAEIQSDGGP